MSDLLGSLFPSPKAPSLRMSSTNSDLFKYSCTNSCEFFTKTSSKSYCITQNKSCINILTTHLNATHRQYLQLFFQSSNTSKKFEIWKYGMIKMVHITTFKFPYSSNVSDCTFWPHCVTDWSPFSSFLKALGKATIQRQKNKTSVFGGQSS